MPINRTFFQTSSLFFRIVPVTDLKKIKIKALSQIKTAADWVKMPWSQHFRLVPREDLRFPNTDVDEVMKSNTNPKGWVEKEYRFMFKLEQGKNPQKPMESPNLQTNYFKGAPGTT